jgi:hypothetical protein
MTAFPFREEEWIKLSRDGRPFRRFGAKIRLARDLHPLRDHGL